MAQRKVSINNIPTSLLETIKSDISTFTIGFSKIIGENESEDIKLLGTGTLVKVGTSHAILTAQHVLKLLPTEGRLGLIISQRVGRETIDIQGIRYLEIARGSNDCEGPDLAVVILSSSIASTIAARKNFYDLTKHRERALVNSPDRQYGVWCNIGFIDENTVEKPGRDGYQKIKGFFMLCGFGGPDEPPIKRGEFDYISMPVTYGSSQDIPISFGGMSGGGVWQIQLIQDEGKEMKAGELLLSGVVFYQDQLANDRRNVICHYRDSVYKTAYKVIGNEGS